MWKRSISNFYFIFILRFINCCQCNMSMPHTHSPFEKRQLEMEDYGTTELIVDNNMTETATPYDSSPLTIIEKRKEFNETYAELNDGSVLNYSITDFYDSSTEINGTILDESEYVYDGNDTNVMGSNETTTEEIELKTTNKTYISDRDLVNKCRHFKNGKSFDLEKMADVWQVAYYRIPNRLQCFKLHIKMVKSKEQQRLARVYGSFNNTVHWDKCNLEIKSSEKAVGVPRRHFLQGTQNERGVLDNVIIDEENCHNTTYLTLHRESADQWLVIKNLLVMRDCENGDLVVFNRVPLESRPDDILDALKIFGETNPNGTLACQEKVDRSWLRYEDSLISHQLS